MKSVTVVYTKQFNAESRGYLIESMDEWKDAVKKSRIHSATKAGFQSLLKLYGKVFVNPFGGYCGIDGETIKIVE